MQAYSLNIMTCFLIKNLGTEKIPKTTLGSCPGVISLKKKIFLPRPHVIGLGFISAFNYRLPSIAVGKL